MNNEKRTKIYKRFFFKIIVKFKPIKNRNELLKHPVNHQTTVKIDGLNAILQIKSSIPQNEQLFQQFFVM